MALRLSKFPKHSGSGAVKLLCDNPNLLRYERWHKLGWILPERFMLVRLMESTLPVLLSQVIPLHEVQLEPTQLGKLWLGFGRDDLNSESEILSCG